MTRAERPAQLDHALAARIADEAGVDARLTQVSALGDGVKSEVYRLEFETGDPLALKVFIKPAAAVREIGGYRTLAAAVPELPHVISAAADTTGLPHGHLLMTLVEGVPANTLLAGMPREQLLGIYRELGRIQAEFHSVVCPSFSLVTGAANGEASNREYMRSRFAISLDGFLAHGGNRYLASRIAGYFEEHDELLKLCHRPVACHGDVHFENVFVDPDDPARVLHLIDLEETYAGDPALDLVRTLHHAPKRGGDLLAALLDGYGPAPSWLADVFDLYFTYLEVETWIFYASGGSRGPLPSIARRIARRVGVSRRRIWRSHARRLISPAS